MKIKQPAVAGKFYPADPDTLQKLVRGYLNGAEGSPTVPKAMIVPHAGYIYSGAIAATAYRWLMDADAAKTIKRVILLGPSHFVPVPGISVLDVDAVETPLGTIPVDRDIVNKALTMDQVLNLPAAHKHEHSLEVHLPFLQTVLGDFSVAMFAMGSTFGREVAELLELLWGGDETLIIVSSDLSHFHDYETAQTIDAATAQSIEIMHPDAIELEHACGRYGIQGLLLEAQQHQLKPKLIDLRNSGDTAGTKERVVGYGAWVFV